MKFNIKNLGIGILIGTASMVTSSCNDMLDLEPVNQITPESYYSSADQLGAYLNNYYNSFLAAPYSGSMFHASNYNDGMAQSDGNTDIMCVGGGNTTLFSNDHWEVSSDKALQGYYGNVRICNYFLEKATSGFEAGNISGSTELIKNYIGEGYFFRAITYFRMLALYGDLPIVTEVLEDKNDVLVANSQRAPRNEVARFILQDLDKAIANLANRSMFNGQRLNKEAALLFKSRVALFEATFEKYHKGSGRVPGDANWPGAQMPYNSGKSFNIDSEIDFFLTEAMNAARQIGDITLTQNNGIMQPQVGTIAGWNPYFEMYSQSSLAGVPEVLLWKQYSRGQSITHDVPRRTMSGCNDGYTRSFIQSFLMKSGLPIYADADYQEDVTLDDTKANRDERLQLFVWGESNVLYTDPIVVDSLRGTEFGNPGITEALAEIRSITGYQPRKYFTYDYDQYNNDELRGINACPIFRSAEAMLNYIEACYEKTGSIDGTAASYWRALRERAGVSTDFNATIAATDLSQELDLAVYSGTAMVSPTLYNIRRERVNELFSEGQRFADLIRWRSFDKMITTKWVPEGCNFWDNMYKFYEQDTVHFIANGSNNATVSKKELGKYLRPYSRSLEASNELRDGYTWHEAYYLYPLGISDLRTASSDRDLNTSNMYQNINWPAEAGGHALK
ncbi:RagB/SusD family nutrient uptake outer membrane protein [Odoribacter lunatus]|uniref:RagB/SusD family nutrient uptake outer membrane protein n=1 Tax=Odoribacter lunatus TaxID=2941335 RepID=UPI00203EF5AB|nr:RagB/SusD family nutrient uptake outer membrane protein [Odoribacter lunatus]